MNNYKTLVREGVVTSVIPERCAIRVTFEDRDGLVSAELPVLQSSCWRDKFYALPDVDDEVICLMAPNDPNGNSGYVIGSRYHDKCEPPAASQDISMIKFDDGTTISYDRSSHELRIDCVGKILINGLVRID